MMTCEESERQLLELSGEPQGELREHLAGCADCRAFRAVVATLESGCGGAVAPSAELDAAVLRLGCEELRGVRRRRLRRLLTRGVAAAAAVVAVSALSLTWLASGGEGASGVADGARALAHRQESPSPSEEMVAVGQELAASKLYADVALDAWEQDVTRLYLTATEPELAEPEPAEPSSATPVLPMDAEFVALSSELDTMGLLVSLDGH
ncbi:MAG: hypothetical protein ACI4WT_14490 [Oligosphaeraceae bacterium]